MSIKCLLNGVEVNYPCSPVCALYGDCVTAFEAQKKENVRTNADYIREISDKNRRLCIAFDAMRQDRDYYRDAYHHLLKERENRDTLPRADIINT